MDSAVLPLALTGVGWVAAVLLGVWGIAARYHTRVLRRMDAQHEQLRDRIDAWGRSIPEAPPARAGMNRQRKVLEHDHATRGMTAPADVVTWAHDARRETPTERVEGHRR